MRSGARRSRQTLLPGIEDDAPIRRRFSGSRWRTKVLTCAKRPRSPMDWLMLGRGQTWSSLISPTGWRRQAVCP